MKTKIIIPFACLVLFCACRGKGNYEVAGSRADTSGKNAAPGDTAKLIKTANISFKVKNVQQTATQVIALTQSFGGMVLHQQLGAVPGSSQDIKLGNDSIMRITSLGTTAALIVKVPSVKLEKFVDSVASMGLYTTDRSIDITDKSLDYLSARLKLKSRAELIKRQQSGKVIIKDPANVLNLQDDMIDQQIGNRKIDDAVKYSVVNLNFSQSNTIDKEVMVDDDPSAFHLPFIKRAGFAFQNGWQLFVDLLVGIINLWIFFLAGFVVWMVVRHYKRKRPVELVKS